MDKALFDEAVSPQKRCRSACVVYSVGALRGKRWARKSWILALALKDKARAAGSVTRLGRKDFAMQQYKRWWKG